MIEGIVLIHEKRRGGGKITEDVAGRIRKEPNGTYSFYASFSKELTEVAVQKKDHGFLVGIKKEPGSLSPTGYICFVEGGLKLNTAGKSTRGSFSTILHETEYNKDFLRRNANKRFTGTLIDSDTVKIVF